MVCGEGAMLILSYQRCTLYVGVLAAGQYNILDISVLRRILV